MSRRLAIFFFVALCAAEVLLRASQAIESVGRAACPCGGEL
jgi:hypothetical protein